MVQDRDWSKTKLAPARERPPNARSVRQTALYRVFLKRARVDGIAKSTPLADACSLMRTNVVQRQCFDIFSLKVVF
jgi:hypothetical protein